MGPILPFTMRRRTFYKFWFYFDFILYKKNRTAKVGRKSSVMYLKRDRKKRKKEGEREKEREREKVRKKAKEKTNIYSQYRPYSL